jgi:hypothetical protein
MTLFQLTMGLLALGIMLLLGRGRLQRFGFRRRAPLPLSRVLLTVLVAEVPILVAFLPFVRPGAEHFVADFSFWQIVVGVWIVASTTEEIVVRGLFQSYLEPLSSVRLAAGRLAVSLPVVAGALLFAAMHLPLLALGIDPVLGAEILVMTLALGLIAGHFREVTGSLLPAIVAHSFANITGMGAETLSRALGL